MRVALLATLITIASAFPAAQQKPLAGIQPPDHPESPHRGESR